MLIENSFNCTYIPEQFLAPNYSNYFVPLVFLPKFFNNRKLPFIVLVLKNIHYFINTEIIRASIDV